MDYKGHGVVGDHPEVAPNEEPRSVSTGLRDTKLSSQGKAQSQMEKETVLSQVKLGATDFSLFSRWFVLN